VTGSLNPDETVSVSAEVPGRVLAIYADFGQNVRKGQVLAELDKQELNLGVERSKASLAQALARLGLDAEQENVRPETTPAIRQAQAQLEDAKSKYDNAARLVKSGDISQERFTEIQKQYQARQALYEAARDEARTLLAQVQALKTEVSLARKRLNDATVRAPFDGAVGQKLVSAGQYIKENTAILTLVKTTPLRLRMDVPEAGAGTINVGTMLSFTTDAAPGAQFNAVVRELNPSLDSKSRTLTAEARMTSNDSRLRPGMFVQVQLTLSKGSQGVVVPKRAIYNIAGLNKLFIIQNGKATEKRITPGQDLGDWIEVPADAVRPGDSVAVSGLDQLVTGTPVRSTPKG
jgi:RND family efflux transporter MFP subunit